MATEERNYEDLAIKPKEFAELDRLEQINAAANYLATVYENLDDILANWDDEAWERGPRYFAQANDNNRLAIAVRDLAIYLRYAKEYEEAGFGLLTSNRNLQFYGAAVPIYKYILKKFIDDTTIGGLSRQQSITDYCGDERNQKNVLQQLRYFAANPSYLRNPRRMALGEDNIQYYTPAGYFQKILIFLLEEYGLINKAPPRLQAAS